MSYTNQPDHPHLDRQLIADSLRALSAADVAAGAGGLSREAQFERLSRLAASQLERRWLKHVMDAGLALPSDAAVLVEKAGMRPDFLYRAEAVAVYVDGPPHDFPERAARDARQEAAMEDLGYVVLRFRHDADWDGLIKQYPSVFGVGN